MKTKQTGIENRLAATRVERGYSAAQLAKLVGVTRQTIYSIETGSYTPNTTVALKLARALEIAVDQLFRLEDDAPRPPARAETATLLAGSDFGVQPGQPVQLCRLNRGLMALPASPVPWFFPSSDGVVAGPSSKGRAKIQVLHPQADFSHRILVAGCDPGIGVLARYAQAAGVELVLAHRNSSQALSLLRDGHIHIAGTHLRDPASGESNLPEIGRVFTKTAVAVVSFAVWEEGFVTAPGNPKEIRDVTDLVRSGVAFVNREPGAGSRRLLDAHLKREKLNARKIRGYDSTAAGHLAAAWQVLSGAADCCIATRAAAQMLGLGFVPLSTERYDFALRREHLDLPAVQALFDTLTRSTFRRELETLGGYDASAAGRRLL